MSILGNEGSSRIGECAHFEYFLRTENSLRNLVEAQCVREMSNCQLKHSCTLDHKPIIDICPVAIVILSEHSKETILVSGNSIFIVIVGQQ